MAASLSIFWAVSRPYSVPARVWISPHGLPSVTARPPRTPPSVWPNRRKRAMWKRATRTNPSATTSPRSRRRTTPCRRNPSSPMRIWFSASVPSSSILPARPPSRVKFTAPCPPVWNPPSRFMSMGSCLPAWYSAAACLPSGSSTASALPATTSCCLTVKAATASLLARWKPSRRPRFAGGRRSPLQERPPAFYCLFVQIFSTPSVAFSPFRSHSLV